MQRCQMRLQVTVTAASGGDAEEGPTAGELRKLRGRLASKFPQPAVKIESEQLEDTGLNIVCYFVGTYLLPTVFITYGIH